jgi:hypothetical protein
MKSAFVLQTVDEDDDVWAVGAEEPLRRCNFLSTTVESRESLLVSLLLLPTHDHTLAFK